MSKKYENMFKNNNFIPANLQRVINGCILKDMERKGKRREEKEREEKVWKGKRSEEKRSEEKRSE